MNGGTLPENELLDQTVPAPPVEVPEAPAGSYRQEDVDMIDKAYEGK